MLDAKTGIVMALRPASNFFLLFKGKVVGRTQLFGLNFEKYFGPNSGLKCGVY